MRSLFLVLLAGVFLPSGALGQSAGAATHSDLEPLPHFPEGCTFAVGGNHPYFPLHSGDRWVYRSDDEDEDENEGIQVVRQVLAGTHRFPAEPGDLRPAVEATRVRDTLTRSGREIAVITRFYAQCVETGTVFLFGQEVVASPGSTSDDFGRNWLVGAEGNEPGVVLPGAPVVGDIYPLGFAPGVAEGLGEIAEVGLSVGVPAGRYLQVMKVRVLDPIAAGSAEGEVLYAPGVGMIAGHDLELVEFSSEPALRIETAVRLSWNPGPGQFVVEAGGSVTGPWITLDVPVRDASDGKEAWLRSSDAARFFRLRRL